jgi:hypothetical protein
MASYIRGGTFMPYLNHLKKIAFKHIAFDALSKKELEYLYYDYEHDGNKGLTIKQLSEMYQVSEDDVIDRLVEYDIIEEI